MRMHWTIFLGLFFLAPTWAAEPGHNHGTHGDQATPAQAPATPAPSDMGAMDHEHMHHESAPPPANATWSYAGRDNPGQATQRWEMIPVPGYGHMFVSTQNISPELVCAALDNPGIMVDHATRQRCNFAAPEQPPHAPATHDEHAGHSGH